MSNCSIRQELGYNHEHLRTIHDQEANSYVHTLATELRNIIITF